MQLSNLPLPVVLLIAIVVAAIGLRFAVGVLGKKGNRQKPRARRPLTANEQKMYFRLAESAPDLLVLAQISFSSLLTAKQWAVRNTFNRKVADFALCDRGFNVIAIVELDDSSHDGKGHADTARDALLSGAGYKVLRWRGIPDVATVKQALEPLRPRPK